MKSTINTPKRAFTDGSRSRIVAWYDCSGPNWTLSVHDNGVGVPIGSEAAVPGPGPGIVEALARRLHARVQVEGANPEARVSIIRTQIVALEAGTAGRAAEKLPIRAALIAVPSVS